MTMIRHQRTKLLRSAGNRFLNPPSAKLLLFANPTTFFVDGTGGGSPERIELTPALFGLSGQVQYSALGASVTRVGDGNEAIVAFGDMTADTAVVTASLTANGQTFEHSVSITKTYAALNGEEVSESLMGRLTEEHLVADLRSRIDLVDAGVEMVGSVTGRIKAETDARVAQLDAAISAATQARDAFVKAYTYSKVESDAAEALQTFNVTTAYTTYVDGQTGAVLTNAQSYVRSYTYSKTESDSALSAMASTLRSEMTSGAGTSEAWVTNYAYSKSQVDSSEAAQFNTLTANYRAYANDARDVAISTSTANYTNYAYSKASSDSALSAMATQLRTEFTDNNGASIAWVQSYTYSKSEADGAIASYNQTLVSRVGNAETAIQTQIQTTDGLKGQYTVKIDNNGYVTGYGLASSYVNGVPTSAFVVNAARFAIVAPGQTPKYMFRVANVAGQTTIAMDGSIIADGTFTLRAADGSVIIDAGKSLAEQARSNPNLAPNCRGFIMYGASSNRNGDTRFGDGQYIYAPPTPDGRYAGAESPPLGIPWGAIYTVSFDAYCEGAHRVLNVDVVNSQDWDSGGASYTITNENRRYKFTETAIASGNAPNGRLRIFTVAPGGSPIVISNIKVELGDKMTPWNDSIITPENVIGRVMPNSITNTQFGGDLWGSQWNGQVGPGGAGWLLQRNGDIYLNNADVRGRVIGSIIESSVFKVESARIMSTYDRLSPFMIFDTGMQMYSSGTGNCEVVLDHFVGPLNSVQYSYNVKRFATSMKDVYLKAYVSGNGSVGLTIAVMYNNDGNWQTIVNPGMDLSANGSITISVRYTTIGGVWDTMKFRAITVGGATTALTFDMQMFNFHDTYYLGGTNSGISSVTPPPPPPPPTEPPEPYCVDYETARLPSGRYVREVIVDELIEVWNDDPESPRIEFAPAMRVRFGSEQSYNMRSSSGAEIIQSRSTPMTLRDGRVATTDLMLGEDVLVNRRGILAWEPVVELIDVGVRTVVKLSLGDRMYFAGSDPRATIATHNIQYKP